MGDVLSGEILTLMKEQASHLSGQILYGLSPNLYTSRKSKHAGRKNLMCLLFFSVSEVFAVAKVKLCNTQ